MPDQLVKLEAGAVIINTVRRPLREDLPQEGTQDVLIAPLTYAGRCEGLLTFDYGGADHAYSDEERQLAQDIARLITLVLERERLVRERALARADVLALEEANRRMFEFIGIASHELKTPVTVLLASTQTLLKHVQQSQPEQFSTRDVRMLVLMEAQIKRVNRLLRDLVDVTRIRSGSLEPELAQPDLVPLIAAVVEELCLAQPQRTIQIDVPAGPVWVLADADRIGQVLTKYLTNALKYSDPDQSVLLHLMVEAETVRVEVQDRGPGIPPEHLPRIWEAFHRVPTTEVRSGSEVGLGLGLHICKTIIERHHGAVGVANAETQGATFWFTLPRQAQMDGMAT